MTLMLTRANGYPCLVNRVALRTLTELPGWALLELLPSKLCRTRRQFCQKSYAARWSDGKLHGSLPIYNVQHAARCIRRYHAMFNVTIHLLVHTFGSCLYFTFQFLHQAGFVSLKQTIFIPSFLSTNIPQVTPQMFQYGPFGSKILLSLWHCTALSISFALQMPNRSLLRVCILAYQ